MNFISKKYHSHSFYNLRLFIIYLYLLKYVSETISCQIIIIILLINSITLILRNKKFTDEGLKNVANALQKLVNLTSINLNFYKYVF